MQQGGGSHSHQYILGGGSSTPAADQSQQHQMVVEEASPISSRPPAPGSLDEFGLPIPGAGGNFPDMDALASAAAAGDDPDRGGGSGGAGNRWPRQETLALLKIRKEMDGAFRDATVKGPLWEDVSRKLAELGYKRSAKKCKEKFENVDKYYKRTKEGRAGRQDGKTYKFFTELEALHNTAAPPPLTAPPPAAGNFIGIGFSSPMPISSVRPLAPSVSSAPAQQHVFQTVGLIPGGAPGSTAAGSSPIGLEFSSNSSSSSPETEDDDDDNEGTDLEGEPSSAAAAGSSRKRKRESGGGGRSRRMMEFFEGLMKQVMQKQEAMQQRFLEAVEKREQDRLMREEAWRRQEMARLAREHEIMAQERAVSASRDASILAFLQKITGQTVQLPPVVTIPTTTTTTIIPPVPVPIPVTPQPTTQSYHHQQQPQHQQQQQQKPHTQHQLNVEPVSVRHQSAVSTEVVLAAVPEQQVRIHETLGGGSGSGSEPPSSSRWPKTEVLALIKLRSGLESRYQEAGPKGPLWEEISAGMQRMGYKRSAKRCKEKWENINKYFKKVKESNKKRPEDAKTCPYFHELDALYRKKILGGGSSGSTGAEAGSIGTPMEQRLDAPIVGVQESQQTAQATEAEAKNGGDSGAQTAASTIGEGNGGTNKPEDIVKELIGQQQQQQHGVNPHGSDQNQQFELRHDSSSNGSGLLAHGANNNNEEEDEHDDGMDEDEDDDEEEEEEEDEELEEGRKMAYKIEFQQRQNAGPPNGGGSGAAASFLAMVQ